MDSLKAVYKILKVLESAMDYEEFDSDLISPETLGITKERRDNLLIDMQEKGYIKGLNIKKYIRGGAVIIPPINPEITIDGIDFLHNNSTMKKIGDALQGFIGSAVTAFGSTFKG